MPLSLMAGLRSASVVGHADGGMVMIMPGGVRLELQARCALQHDIAWTTTSCQLLLGGGLDPFLHALS